SRRTASRMAGETRDRAPGRPSPVAISSASTDAEHGGLVAGASGPRLTRMPRSGAPLPPAFPRKRSPFRATTPRSGGKTGTGGSCDGTPVARAISGNDHQGARVGRRWRSVAERLELRDARGVGGFDRG